MNDIDKVRFMYESVHGAINNTTSAEVEVIEEYNDYTYQDEVKVICTKDGHRCWAMSREDVLFDYITSHFTK